MEECISAISTAKGVGGVAIIRLSGKNSFEIAKKMFSSSSLPNDIEPYKMYVGKIDACEFFDFGMCVFFKAPRSYTGEDMVEFHCHGGLAISQGILKQTFKLGAIPATNGEFTKRAFVNGKLSLSSCEGLIDMINGESISEAKCGFYLYREKLLKRILQAQDELTNILAQIDVDIDYPEEDVPSADKNVIYGRLKKVHEDLFVLSQTFNNAQSVKNGVKVAIVGKPNAGKSSLLNAIIDCDKAIVANVEGTTRDIVEGNVEINGVKFTLFDTAGIRESVDIVEKIGIERSKKALDSADLAVFVIDAESGYDQRDEYVFKSVENINHIVVLNKSDVKDISVDCDLKISAKNKQNIEEFKQLMYKKSNVSNFDFNADFITEQRHYYAVVDALKSLKTAMDNALIMPLDIITVDVRDAWHKLGLISGSTCDQTIIDEIFAKFCVGK